MITCKQLIESFDPYLGIRAVVQQPEGILMCCREIPKKRRDFWITGSSHFYVTPMAIKEFQGKKWKDCIYIVEENDGVKKI